MSGDRWYFDKDRLQCTPSRRYGFTSEKELSYLQTTANFIQEMGRKLSLPLLCINTAVLYTQRFYLFHPMNVFERYSLGAAALFLAAKVEEHPRKVEHVCQMTRLLRCYNESSKDTAYIEEMLFNENVLITTLGFELHVEHPHQHILRLCNINSKEIERKSLSHTAYIMATYCLHLTRMCLVYKPIKIACMCIHIACKMLDTGLPVGNDGQQWFQRADPEITEQVLENLCEELLSVLSLCPEKYKNKTLLANPENLVKRLMGGNTQSVNRNPNNFVLPTSEKPCTKPLVTLHDAIKKVASSLHRNSLPISKDSSEWLVDDMSHDPNKHSRKMVPTPTKDQSAIDIKILPLPPPQFPTLPQFSAKTDKVVINLDSKSNFGQKEDLHQRNLKVLPSQTSLKRDQPVVLHSKAFASDPRNSTPKCSSIPNAPKYRRSEALPSAKASYEKPATASEQLKKSQDQVKRSVSDLTGQTVKLMQQRKSLKMKFDRKRFNNIDMLHWDLNLGNDNESQAAKAWDPGQFHFGSTPPTWNSMSSIPVLINSEPSEPSNSIPKRRISNFDSSSVPRQLIASDDVKTDKPSLFMISTAAPMRSDDVLMGSKRFKPNPK